ncbi:MAG: MtnX-like HAD-IB family phosphatase [bacterium]
MIRVYCDFDGTVARDDVGNRLFQNFVGPNAVEIVEGYLAGTKTARQCLKEECEAVPHLTPEMLEAFVAPCEIDPYFKQFVEFCSLKEIPLTIVSDGLDFYIERILNNFGLGHLQFFSNHLTFVTREGVTKIVPEFPYEDAECPDCGNCKRNHLLTLSGDEDIIIYIGDGISDRCPAQYADVVFAKRQLIKYCQECNITYHDFTHFGDVHRRLELILQRKRLKKRREAEMARRQVFMQG